MKSKNSRFSPAVQRPFLTPLLLLWLNRIAFWLGMTAFTMLIDMAASRLLGVLDPNGFPVRFLAVIFGIVAFIAAAAHILGRTLRDQWEHS